MSKETIDFDIIGDSLINDAHVKKMRVKFMDEDYKVYKKANILLGYFSQLRDYDAEYENLHSRVITYRKNLLMKYKDLLTEEFDDIFKHLLISPKQSEWYLQGVQKYKKVKNYSTYYYRRCLYITLEEETIDLTKLKKIIEKIVLLDKYYRIYDDTILYFMQTSSKFEETMRKHFPGEIHF